MAKEPDLHRKQRDLTRYVLARAEIEAAERLCDFALESLPDPDEPLYWALHNAIAVTYARPFTKNRAVGALGGKWHQFSDDRLEENHRLTLSLRDEIIAHADVEHRPVWVFPPGSELPDGTMSSGTFITMTRIGVGVGSYVAIRELCVDLQPRLEIAVKDAFHALYPEGCEGEPFQIRLDD